MWWILGLLVVGGLTTWLLIRRRHRPDDLQAAYAATAALRDRLAQEVAAPSAGPGLLEGLLDEADRTVRAVQVGGHDLGARTAIESTLAALTDVRGSLALRSATAGATHAIGSDVEAALLRSLAALDAALGPLQAAARGDATTPDPGESTGGFEG